MKTKLQTGESHVNSIPPFLAKPTFLFLFLCLKVNPVFSQVWEWGGSATSLELGTSSNDDLIIVTNGFQQMSIDVLGNVSMGLSGTVTLNVNGDVDIGTSTRSYLIDGNPVLRHKGEPTNIFVGVGAGTTVSGSQGNTFVGCDAGHFQSTSSGGENTFIGCLSGKSSTTSSLNAYLGTGSGQLNQEGTGNTLLGYFSGRNNMTDFNSFVGFQSGYSNTTGYQNTIAGSNAGYNNETGFGNVFIGVEAGYTNVDGIENTYIGYGARGLGDNQESLFNATAIGAFAYCTQNNTLVLGSIANENLAPEDANTSVCIGTTDYGGAKLNVLNEFLPSGAVINTYLVTPKYNYGISAFTGGSEHGNTAGYFAAQDNVDGSNIGVHSIVTGSGSANIAGIFQAPFASTPTLNIGLLVSGKHSALYSGNATIFGHWTEVSDVNLKDSIADITDALLVLSQFQPKTFVFKRDSFPRLNLPSGKQYGFIAQQIDSVLTELVDSINTTEVTDSSGGIILDSMNLLGLNYTGLIPLVVSGVNALNELKVASDESATDSNYVTKWSATNKTLTNSSIYDKAGRVGINTTTPAATLDVDGTADTIGINVVGEIVGILATGDTMGGHFEGQLVGAHGLAIGAMPYHAGVAGISENATDLNIGVVGYVDAAADTVKNAGVYGIGKGSEFLNVGLHGEAPFESETASNVAVSGLAGNSNGENIAGKFVVDNQGTGLNIGVYCTADTPGFALVIEGDITYSGTAYYVSDQQLKKNVEDLSNATEIISHLQPKEYEFKQEDYPYIKLPNGIQRGLLAQEVEQVLPDLVRTVTMPAKRDTSGKILAPQQEFKGINYEGFTPIILKALQEQQAMIDSLAKELAEVKTSVTNCCGGTEYRISNPNSETEMVHELTVELSALQIVILEQNVPNPFAEQTFISYFVPEDAGKAVMQFTDLAGRVIKTVELEKGSGIITVFAQNLGSGTYSYSLIIDGKVAETKKMVKMR